MTKVVPPPASESEHGQADRFYADGGMYFRDTATGELNFIKGAGAMRDHPLKLREDIDLTQPIYEQVYGKS